MLNILWVGRLISYKKPEIAVDVANELNKRRLDFNLRIVGSGILENEVRKRIIDLNLERCVTVEGSKSNEEVRNIMRHSDVFLFTSNEEEGWGAVLNEAMDSGCVCIAYHGIGAVPYLIKDGENGFIYCHHSPAEIANICERLYLERGLIDRISQNAIETIKENWNAEVAAYRLFETANTIIQSNKIIPYEEGPLSIAQRVSCNATE